MSDYIYVSFVGNYSHLHNDYWPLPVTMSFNYKDVDHHPNIKLSFSLYTSNLINERTDWLCFKFDYSTGVILDIVLINDEDIQKQPPGFEYHGCYQVREILEDMQIIQFNTDIKWKKMSKSI